jgi:hypothetical protein
MTGWITEKYEPVTETAVKNLPCPSCGKKVRRQRTFSQTISPFNTNLRPGMTYREQVKAILTALEPQIDAWQAEPVTCTPCEEAQS